MYKKFKDFKEQKNQEKIYRKFDAICEMARTSGKTFNEFWDEKILPVALDYHFETQEEMTDLLLENLGASLGGMAGRAGGAIARNAVDFGKQAFQGVKQGWGAGNQQPQQAQAQQQAGPQFMQQNVDPIKQDFVRGLNSLQKLIQTKHGANDPSGYKVQVLNQLMQSANQWSGNWQPNVASMTQAQAGQQGQAGQQPQTQVAGQASMPQTQQSVSNQP